MLYDVTKRWQCALYIYIYMPGRFVLIIGNEGNYSRGRDTTNDSTWTRLRVSFYVDTLKFLSKVSLHL